VAQATGALQASGIREIRHHRRGAAGIRLGCIIEIVEAKSRPEPMPATRMPMRKEMSDAVRVAAGEKGYSSIITIPGAIAH
jgi:uncharacterized protein YggE